MTLSGKPFTIALSGKGGTGKTTVSSLLIRSFITMGETPVLAVDADPNANLHEALGVSVHETLGSMREEAFTRTIPPGMNRHDYVRYRFRQALVESEGFDLIAMGRPEGSGCYCFANDLLSECMGELERDYHFIVIDTEAGMEHIARGTIGKPDLLLIVSDPGARGLRTIARIREIATQLGLEPEKIQIVFNRFRGGTAPVDIGTGQPIAIIPDDTAVEDADLRATPVSLVPPNSPAKAAVSELAEKIRQMAGKRNQEKGV
ncbi:MULTISPECIES: AAA family ATPase [unclassified Methanoregula]|uniref:ATP-binding protein n=1 Tax=unclassified Methanoregula TaxID=2649730 RepID=UPI0009C71EF7|nr:MULTISPECIES: AAA family ATPase [unclassified Methanoregula]OPX64712.1 MAG: CobQ/CobB/MinD/ParA nucleotide binding domain protein [Methanoregula sp. PtaB.Bin085]OPY35232.1 MAG: CobQ/CobB/MinD/ParA nucleotide binding domain protein [Methanoregula sp. PtaU1.Bin006]